jgi:protein TonB
VNARSRFPAVEHRLAAALAASLAVHAGAMSFPFPAPRAAPLAAPPTLWVTLTDAPAAIVEHAVQAPPDERIAPAPRRGAPAAPASAHKPAEPSHPTTVAEEEAIQTRARVSAVESPAPQPAAPPAEIPAPDVPSPKLLAAYGQTIAETLARHRQYPPIAMMQGWEGSVTMQLRVGATGRLLDAAVHRSSGHGVLDREALAMAARAGRFPPPAGALHGREVAVLVPVVFRLER